MRILVLGVNGMLGHMVYDYLESTKKYQVYGTVRKVDPNDKRNVTELNICENQDCLEIISKLSGQFITPVNVIINCIGTLIKESNENPSRAICINGWFPHYIEELFKNKLTKIIQISTDCVFSGKRGFYKDEDTPDETNFYGRSKAIGEIVNNKDLTLRTSIIGPELKSNGTGLFHWFMTTPGIMSGYINAYWNGFTTLELAKIIEKAIEQNITGLYQPTPKTSISKYDLLVHFNNIFECEKTIRQVELKSYIDKTLLDRRETLEFRKKLHQEMIQELKDWMYQNPEKYKQYIH
jgi:dTDP-4-dehydrorhamnose reductase